MFGNCFNPECPLDIWAPGQHNKIENVAFSSFAFHQQEVEDFIEVLAASDDPNDLGEQVAAARLVGLNLDSLTQYEIDYIQKEVAKRL